MHSSDIYARLLLETPMNLLRLSRLSCVCVFVFGTNKDNRLFYISFALSKVEWKRGMCQTSTIDYNRPLTDNSTRTVISQESRDDQMWLISCSFVHVVVKESSTNAFVFLCSIYCVYYWKYREVKVVLRTKNLHFRGNKIMDYEPSPKRPRMVDVTQQQHHRNVGESGILNMELGSGRSAPPSSTTASETKRKPPKFNAKWLDHPALASCMRREDGDKVRCVPCNSLLRYTAGRSDLIHHTTHPKHESNVRRLQHEMENPGVPFIASPRSLSGTFIQSYSYGRTWLLVSFVVHL